jgi:MFS family permease
MAAAILAACLTQLPMGRLSDRMDRRSVVTAACVVAALAAAAAWWLEGISRGAFFAMIGLYGGMSLTLYSLSLAHVNDQVPAHEMIGASSTLILLNGAGAFLAPLLLATLMGLAGNDIFLPVLAALHLLLAIYAVYRMTRRAPMPEAMKTPYIGTPPGTTSSGELLGHTAEAAGPDAG